MIPPSDSRGLLPPGVHEAQWEEVVDRFGTTAWRQELLEGLQSALTLLSQAGCRRVYIDGSFVTSKIRPGDFDVAWDPDGVDLSELRTLEPVFFDFSDRRRAQKSKFGGEFFPASAQADAKGSTFLNFFQIDKRRGSRKGIIVITLEGRFG